MLELALVIPRSRAPLRRLPSCPAGGISMLSFLLVQHQRRNNGVSQGSARARLSHSQSRPLSGKPKKTLEPIGPKSSTLPFPHLCSLQWRFWQPERAGIRCHAFLDGVPPNPTPGGRLRIPLVRKAEKARSILARAAM